VADLIKGLQDVAVASCIYRQAVAKWQGRTIEPVSQQSWSNRIDPIGVPRSQPALKTFEARDLNYN
jgi:hypothetical protein